MLILDENRIQTHAEMTAAEKEQEEIANYVKDQLSDAVYCEHWDQSPSNYLRQMGRPLMDTMVEAKIKKILPNAMFEHHPHIADKKCLYLVLPNGARRFLLAYEKGLMPERSVMAPVVREHLDPAALRGKTHIDRADLPKHEIVPFELNDQDPTNLADFKGGDVIWDNTQVRPGLKRTEMPWFEAKRGYRAIFAILVGMQLITPTQAENAVGADNRAEWKKAMNKTGNGIL